MRYSRNWWCGLRQPATLVSRVLLIQATTVDRDGADEISQNLARYGHYYITNNAITIIISMTGLAIISGIPTVIGGITATEFLASVEQLDNSRDEQAPKGREWRLVSQVNYF